MNPHVEGEMVSGEVGEFVESASDVGVGGSSGVGQGNQSGKECKYRETKKATTCVVAFRKVAPPARLELATYGLTVRRSTD